MISNDSQQSEEDTSISIQQWTIRSSGQSDIEENELLQSESQSTDESMNKVQSDSTSFSPKRPNGILRLPDTPGTGQSVRFGMRLYDDGDESKMSDSTSISGAFMGLKIASDASPSAPKLVTNIVTDPLEESLDGLDLPTMEGYSNLHDISLDNIQTTLSPFKKQSMDIKKEATQDSFDESFLRAEVERAKQATIASTATTFPSSDSGTMNCMTTSPSRTAVQIKVEQAMNNQSPSKTPSQDVKGDESSYYKTAASHASTRSAWSSSQGQWITPRSDASVSDQDENRMISPPGDHLEANLGSSTSSLSIPWASNLPESPSASRASRLDFSRLTDMSSILLVPGAMSKESQSDKSKLQPLLPDIIENNNNTIEFIPENVKSLEETSPIGEMLEVSRELDRVHSERTQKLLERLQSAEQRSSSLERDLILERECVRLAKLDTDLIRQKAEEDLQKYQQKIEEVNCLVARLNEQLQRRREGISTERKMENVEFGLTSSNGHSNPVSDTIKEDGKHTLLKSLSDSQNGASFRNAEENSAKSKDTSTNSIKDTFDIDTQERLVMLQERLNEEITAHEETARRCEEHETYIDLQRKEFDEIQSEKKKIEEQLLNLRDEQNSMMVELEKLQRIEEEVEEERQGAIVRTADINSEIASLADQLDGKDNQIEEMKLELEQLQSTHSLALQSSKEMEDRLSTVEQSIALRTQDPEMEESGLDEKLNIIQSELHQSQMQSAELQQRLSELETDYERSRNENEDRYSQILQLQKELDDQTAQSEKMKKTIQNLEQEHEALLDTIAETDQHRASTSDQLKHENDLDHSSKVDRKEHEELLDLAENMQNRIDSMQNEILENQKRITSLQRELSDRGMTIVGLEKAKERLEEDNLNLGIALSSKQQELSLLKRSGVKRLNNQPPMSAIKDRSAVRRLTMTPSVQFSSSKEDQTQTNNTIRGIPFKDTNVNTITRDIDDTEVINLPLLEKGPSHLKATRRKTIDGKAVMAKDLSPIDHDENDRNSKDSKAMPPPQIINKSYRSSTISKKSEMNASTSKYSSKRSTTSSSSSIMNGRISGSSMSSSISVMHGPMDLSELTTSQSQHFRSSQSQTQTHRLSIDQEENLVESNSEIENSDWLEDTLASIRVPRTSLSSTMAGNRNSIRARSSGLERSLNQRKSRTIEMT